MDYKQLTPLPNDDILLTVAHSDYFQRITALQLLFFGDIVSNCYNNCLKNRRCNRFLQYSGSGHFLDAETRKRGNAEKVFVLGPGARFSKAPVTFRARNQIFKSKYKQ